MHSSTKIKEIH